ncbi:MAG: hypothetical protein IK104_07700 [Clostridia bacterium]|nr:hypothetical protein [Clostridia bacterium]
MSSPVFDISESEILGVIQKLLETFKKVMQWLGILVLPEEGEYDYPGQEPAETPEG